MAMGDWLLMGVNSGEFSFHPEFVTTGGAYSSERMDALFRSYIAPEKTTQCDVQAILCGTQGRDATTQHEKGYCKDRFLFNPRYRGKIFAEAVEEWNNPTELPVQVTIISCVYDFGGKYISPVYTQLI